MSVRPVCRDGVERTSFLLRFSDCGRSGTLGFLHSTLTSPGSGDLLYGAPFYDPLTLLGLPLVLVIVAAVASGIPAGRASHADPMIALRYE